MPGPNQKHPDHRARRNTGQALTQLSPTGRKGRCPKWPLPTEIGPGAALKMWRTVVDECVAELDDPDTTPQRKRAARNRLNEARREVFVYEDQIQVQHDLELTLWRALWKTPQAEQWELRGWYREVALYARHQVKAELGSLRDSTEARQREDRIGLNDKSMKSLGWEISGAAPASAKTPGTSSPTAPTSKSTYSHLRVVADK